MFNETQKYVVRNKITEAPNIATLELTLADGTVPQFVAGQFITVYFPETKTAEGKAYSISNAPGETTISLTIKAIGEFSHKLCAMEPGDIVTASLPYGYFTNEDNDPKNTLIMLAAGIGIAPFHSIIRDTIKNRPEKKMALFFSAKTLADLIFKKEFDELAAAHHHFQTHYFVTQENNLPKKITGHRITCEDVLRSPASGNNLEFMLCGSIAFNRDLWRALRSAGIPEDQIATEAFFS